MKKLLILSVITSGGLLLGSCKGNYACDCVSGSSTVTVRYYEDVKKSEASSSCDTYYSTYIQPFTPETSCSVRKYD